MDELTSWLLGGDVSIQYQVHRDLLGKNDPLIQDRISREGWGKELLDAMHPDRSWGRGFYQPKWISTHYTLLDLCSLQLHPDTPLIRDIIENLAQKVKAPDGGINPSKTIPFSDVCVSGMFLNYACWFRASPKVLNSVVDSILEEQLPDGGFNCNWNRFGASHSSLHSTICVLEGLLSYKTAGYSYRVDELEKISSEAREFILKHRLFKSDHTGDIIHREMLVPRYPYRWRYSILRSLDYFARCNAPWDDRLNDALQILISKREKDGRWRLRAPYPGNVHFAMERPGYPSRWITLISRRILAKYSKSIHYAS